MKKLFIPFVVLVFLTGAAISPKNVEKEKEAIKKVITEGTDSYRAKNYERMAATWVQDESIVKLRAAKVGYTENYGWKDVGSIYSDDFKDMPEPLTGKYKKVNWKIKVYKESAWSVHDELQYDDEGEETKQIITHFLEKHKGEWKVVFMSQIFPSTYEVEE
jgi:hypothetical protein